MYVYRKCMPVEWPSALHSSSMNLEVSKSVKRGRIRRRARQSRLGMRIVVRTDEGAIRVHLSTSEEGAPKLASLVGTNMVKGQWHVAGKDEATLVALPDGHVEVIPLHVHTQSDPVWRD